MMGGMDAQNPISGVRTADLPGVRSLIAAAIRGSVADTEADAEFLIADINETLDKWLSEPEDSVHLKYEVGGEILGVALVKKFWNLSNLFVAPARQRQGIGRALINEVLRACRLASPRGKVEVNSSQVAVPFYESQGFRRTGRSHARRVAASTWNTYSGQHLNWTDRFSGQTSSLLGKRDLLGKAG